MSKDEPMLRCAGDGVADWGADTKVNFMDARHERGRNICPFSRPKTGLSRISPPAVVAGHF